QVIGCTSLPPADRTRDSVCALLADSAPPATGPPAPACRESRPSTTRTAAYLSRAPSSTVLRSLPRHSRTFPIPAAAKQRAALPSCADPTPIPCDIPADRPPGIPDAL